MWTNEDVRQFALSETKRSIKSGKGSRIGGGFIASTYEPQALKAIKERDYIPASYINDTGRVWTF